VKEAKKVVNLKKKTLTKEKAKGMLIAKEKEKGLFEKKSLRKQLDTIVNPPNKHTIVDQGCSWTTPSKNYLGDVFFIRVLIRHHIFWEIRHF